MPAYTTNKSNQVITFAITSTIAFIIAFFPALQKMVTRWNNGDNSYCYLIIPLFLFLLWEDQRSFNFKYPSYSYWGVLLAVVSIFLSLLGILGSIETVLFAGLWGCLVAIIISIYGLRTRHLLFPIIILFFIIPLPPYINRMLTFKLKLLASSMSADMLRATGVSVLLEGNILDLGMKKLQVVDACSGLRYLMSMVLMALLMGYYFTKQWWPKMILIALVPPMLILINASRIFLTGIFTVNNYTLLTGESAHDAQGILFFMVAGLFFWGITRLMQKIPFNQDNSATSEDKYNLATSSPAPPSFSKGIIITSLICIIFLTGGYYSQHLSKQTTSPPRKSFSTFPARIGNWVGERHYLSKEILDALWADDYISASFRKAGLPNTVYLLIPFYQYQTTRHTAHTPQSCLLGGGYEIIQSKLHYTIGPKGKKAAIRTMLLQKGDHRMLASYFFFQRGRIITSPWMNKYYLLHDAISQGRTDGALVRIEITLANSQSFEQGLPILDDFMTKLWPYLPEYIPQ